MLQGTGGSNPSLSAKYDNALWALSYSAATERTALFHRKFYMRRSTQVAVRGSPAKGVGWGDWREGSNPSFSATSEQSSLCFDVFLLGKRRSPVPLRLLFQKRQRFFGYIRPQTLSASSAPENVKPAARQIWRVPPCQSLVCFAVTASNAPLAARLTTTAFTTHNAAVSHVSAPVKNVATSRMISAIT